MLASEQALRKESERLKTIEEQARKSAQEKMNFDMEQAKQKEINEKETATHKISELIAKQQHLEQEKINLEEKNKLLTEQIYSLEYVKQKEINEKETATHKISELIAKQQHLIFSSIIFDFFAALIRHCSDSSNILI